MPSENIDTQLPRDVTLLTAATGAFVVGFIVWHTGARLFIDDAAVIAVVVAVVTLGAVLVQIWLATRQLTLAKRQLELAQEELDKVGRSLDYAEKESVLVSKQLRTSQLSLILEAFDINETETNRKYAMGVRPIILNSGRTIGPVLLEIYLAQSDLIKIRRLGDMKVGDGLVTLPDAKKYVRLYTLVATPVFENHNNIVPDSFAIITEDNVYVELAYRLTSEDGEVPVEDFGRCGFQQTRVYAAGTARSWFTNPVLFDSREVDANN